MRKFVCVMLVFAWCYGRVPALLGQAPGQLRGMVEDPNGAAVPQATLKLTPSGGGTALKTESDNAGHFAFAAVAPGDYLLTVRVAGFEKEEFPFTIGAKAIPD